MAMKAGLGSGGGRPEYRTASGNGEWFTRAHKVVGSSQAVRTRRRSIRGRNVVRVYKLSNFGAGPSPADVARDAKAASDLHILKIMQEVKAMNLPSTRKGQ